MPFTIAVRRSMHV